MALSFHQHLILAAHLPAVVLQRNLALQGDDFVQPAGLLLLRNVVGQVLPRVGALAQRILEHVGVVVAHLVEELQRGLVVLQRLAGEAGDDIGGDGAVGQVATYGRHAVQIPLHGVFPVHQLQHPVAATLHRKVDTTADVRMPCHHLQQPVAEVLGVRRGEAHPQLRVYRRHHIHQFGETHVLPRVAVHVLSQQRHLAVALPEERAGLANDGLGVAAALAAAGVGHHAVGAIVLATAHNADIGRDAVARQAHRLDVVVGLGGAQLHLGSLLATTHLLQHLRQPTVGVGAAHETHIVLLGHQAALQTLGHAAQHAHAQARTAALQGPQLAHTVAHTLLGVVADGAGIDQDEVGLASLGGHAIARLLQDGSYHLAVGEVHLASVSLYIYVFHLLKVTILKMQKYTKKSI